MCSNESPPPSKEPLVGLGVGNPMAGFLPSLDQYRLQFYHYAMAERLRQLQMHPQHQVIAHPQSGAPASHLGMASGFPAPLPLYPAAAAAYPGRLALSMALLHPHHQRIPEEPKPQHSYIGLIAMAILSSPEKKLVLSDIYQHILEHYPYFRSRGPGWRNSIRHNLSLNDCFVKSGRSANGKGHYWAIHPANLEDFRRGDFRRRKAQRKVRRHMGLAVDEEPDSPSPPPLPATPPSSASLGPPVSSQPLTSIWSPHHHHSPQQPHQVIHNQSVRQSSTFQPSSRKRQFDVASLLAPDDQRIECAFRPSKIMAGKDRRFSCSEDEHESQEVEPEVDQDEEEVDVDVDVVAESNVDHNSPSTSPESKIVASNEHWNNQSLQASPQQILPSIHVHNHLQVRNYYIHANANSGSAV